jgi:hypothetical protein
MANASDVFRVCGVSKRPVIHDHLGSFFLGLPKRVHENIHSAVGGRIGMTIEDRDSKDHSRPLLASGSILSEHGSLAIELRLSVQVRCLGRGISLVWCISWRPGKDIVCGNVDEEDVLGRSQTGKRLARCDIQSPGALRVLVDLVRESLGSTMHNNLGSGMECE